MHLIGRFEKLTEKIKKYVSPTQIAVLSYFFKRNDEVLNLFVFGAVSLSLWLCVFFYELVLSTLTQTTTKSTCENLTVDKRRAVVMVQSGH